ncbi:MAG: hypothetical protein AAB430_01405 [Patescibacteria group bacterium]|mgnify:CR=1 FL=1
MKKLSLLFSILLLVMGTTAVLAWEKDGNAACENVFAKIKNDDVFRYSNEADGDGYVKYIRTEADNDGDSIWEWQISPVEGDITNNAWVDVNWTPPVGFVGEVEALAAIYENDNPADQTWDTPGDFADSKKVTGHLDCSSEPESSPSPSPETSPEPKVEYGLTASSPDCSNSFHAEFKVKVGGVGQKDITVKFSYKAEEKTAKTNSDGIAGVDFEFKGNGDLTAKSEGYENQTIGVQAKENCAAGGSTSSNGQVLGASTLAETGVFDESLMALLFTLGSGLIGLGVKTYAKKN